MVLTAPIYLKSYDTEIYLSIHHSGIDRLMNVSLPSTALALDDRRYKLDLDTGVSYPGFSTDNGNMSRVDNILMLSENNFERRLSTSQKIIQMMKNLQNR